MLTHFHITQCGSSHIAGHKPCDDNSSSERLEAGGGQWIAAAVADGVGSAENSRFGSKTAVETALSYVRSHIDGNTGSLDDIFMNCLCPAFDAALTAIEDRAAADGFLPESLDTTLTVCLFNGKDVYFGHCGDDGIVALYGDGSYEMITTRMKGEEDNSVYPLRIRQAWQFGYTKKMVASLALMTDGVLDHVVARAPSQNNRVYRPFLKPILGIPIVSDEEAEEVKSAWEHFLAGEVAYHDGNFRTFVTDDISLVVIQNSDAVADLQQGQAAAETAPKAGKSNGAAADGITNKRRRGRKSVKPRIRLIKSAGSKNITDSNK